MSKEYRRKQIYCFLLSLFIYFGVGLFCHYAIWVYISVSIGDVWYVGGFSKFFVALPLVVYPFVTIVMAVSFYDVNIPMVMRRVFPRVWQEHDTVEKGV